MQLQLSRTPAPAKGACISPVARGCRGPALRGAQGIARSVWTLWLGPGEGVPYLKGSEAEGTAKRTNDTNLLPCPSCAPWSVAGDGPRFAGCEGQPYCAGPVAATHAPCAPAPAAAGLRRLPRPLRLRHRP